MTIPRQTAATTRGDPMTALRKTALVAGIFYLISFVSIPTLALYGTLKTDQGFITSSGSSTAVLWGAFLEMIVALAGIGTAVALFPVLKRQNEGVALGFVGSRVLEGGAILAGVACLLSVVTLRQAGAGADALVTGHALVALYDRIFLLSQSFIPAVNALLLGSLLYRSRLVPRVLPLLGLIGAPFWSLATSPCCSVSSGSMPLWQVCSHSRSRYGSFRWASGSLLKGSGNSDRGGQPQRVAQELRRFFAEA